MEREVVAGEAAFLIANLKLLIAIFFQKKIIWYICSRIGTKKELYYGKGYTCASIDTRTL